MTAGVKKPYVGQAPILDEAPVLTDWGQLVRHVGPLVVTGADETRPATAVVTKVTVSAVVVTLAAANADRRQLVVYNFSSRVLYLKWGAAASMTDWSIKLRKDDYYEFPFPSYIGIVTGIWSGADVSSSNYAQVTEATP